MDIVTGSIIVGKSGVRLEVVDLVNRQPIVNTSQGLKPVSQAAIVTAIHPIPRRAVSIIPNPDRPAYDLKTPAQKTKVKREDIPKKTIVLVDGDRLSLDYQPTIPIPNWEPTTKLKPYEELSKVYIDIETTGLDSQVDRVLMVGLLDQKGETTIITDHDEQVILTKTIAYLKRCKPECLIGHNLVNFDLTFLMTRWEANKISHPFRKDDKTSRITAASVFGKPIEYTPIYWSGVNIIDTYQQIAIWDKQAAKLSKYDLKSSVIALGLRDNRRLELSVNEIRRAWEAGDTKTIEEYLRYDLVDTELLADFLLPVVYYQLAYVPAFTFQQIAVASPALKAQKIHQKLSPHIDPTAEESRKFDGAKVDLIVPGLHRNVAKIDVSSLYPSVMLRYGLCSWKDTENKFLGVLRYMVDERLRLKALAKSGDKSADFQQGALKILINGSYGFFGTGGYGWNDYGTAALVTAYGRSILDRMVEVVSSQGGTVIEIDTDGVFFSHPDPKTVTSAVAQSLPDGINIELELSDCCLYAPTAKNYVIVYPDGKTTVKGLYRKRDRYALEKRFPVEFIRRYFMDSPAAADDYYQQTRSRLVDRRVDVEDLTVSKKISISDKKLTGAGFGKHGERVSFWMGEGKRVHKTTGKQLASKEIPTMTEPYWIEYYLKRIDAQYREIIGIKNGLDSDNTTEQLAFDWN